MAFMKNINDLIGILTLVVLTLPSIATNIDCDGKPFHCVNSTHFMICVYLGSGVSSTIDDFVIPCPPTTFCQGTNRFECEFPAVPTTTTTIAPSAAPQVTSVSEMIGTETTPFYDMTTSIPFEEYFNTLSPTTLSEDVLLTHQTIVTESILVTNVIPGFDSNSTLSDTKATNFVQNEITPLNNLSSAAFPTNISDTVTESIFTGVIETTPNINVELNLTALNTALPDITVDIVTVTEHMNLIKSKSNSTSNETIQSGNVMPNESKTRYTPSSKVLADAILTETIVTKVTESINVVKLEPNTTFNETPASVNVVPNYLTLPNISSTTGYDTEAYVTDVTENINVLKPESSTILSETLASVHNIPNDLTSPNDSSSTDTIDTESKVTNMTETFNALQSNITLSETPASIDVVTHNPTSLNASSTTAIDTQNAINPKPITTLSDTPARIDDVQNNPTSQNVSIGTAINTEAVTNVTENINVIKPGPNTTSSGTPASIDVVRNDPTSLVVSSSTAINTEAITNVTDNLNVLKPEPKTTFIETLVVVPNYSTSYASSTAATDIQNVIENINVINPEPITTLSETLTRIDVTKNYPTSLYASSSTAIDTEAVTYMTEDINVIEPEPHTILSVTPASFDVVPNDPTLLDVSSSTAIDTEAITNVIDNLNVLKPEPETTFSETLVVVPNYSTSYASSTAAIDTQNVIENINVINPEPITTLSKTLTRIDVTQNDPTSFNASSSTTIDTEAVTYMTEDIIVIKPEPHTILSVTPASFDVVPNDPHLLNASSSTAIDPISNDDMQNDFTTPNTRSSFTSPYNTEPVTANILLKNITVNAISKENKTENYSSVTDTNGTIKVIITPSTETTSASYQGSSTVSFTNGDVETTPSYVLKTTVISKEDDSVTYSNLNYHTDTEKISRDQRVLTNQTDGKLVHTEKVLSSGTIENIASTPTYAIKDNIIIFTDFLVTDTDTASEVTPSSNMDTIILNIDSTTTIKKPDILVSKPLPEITSSPVTDIMGITSALETAVINDNVLLATNLENLTKKSIKAKKEGGSLLPLVFTSPASVSITENPKDTYFITGKQFTTFSIVGDRKSTAVRDNNQLITANKPLDSLSKSSDDTNNPVIIKSVDGFTNTEQITLATIFTSTETGQELDSDLSNVDSTSEVSITESAYFQNPLYIGKDSDPISQGSFKEAASIAITSTTTTDSSNSLGLSSSTNIGQHSIKKVTAFRSETDTKTFNNTRPVTENQTKTIIKEAKLLAVNTVSSTASSVPEFEQTNTVMITTEAANNSYVEPPSYVKSGETTTSSLFNLQSEITPSSEIPDITTAANVTGAVLSINFAANPTNISIDSQNTAQEASSTFDQEMVTSLPQTKRPVQNFTTVIVTTNTSELLTVSLGNTQTENSLRDDSYSPVNKANFTVIAAEENIMFTNIDVEAPKENNSLVSLLLNSATVQTTPYREYTIPAKIKPTQEETVRVTSTKLNELSEKLIGKNSTQMLTLMGKKKFGGSTKQETYTESNILNEGYGKPSKISSSIKNMPDVQMITKLQVTTAKIKPEIETPQTKQIVVSGQADQSLFDYLGIVSTSHDIANKTQIPEKVQQLQAPTDYYDGKITSHNQQNFVSQQDNTPLLDNLSIKPSNDLIITQQIQINTSKIQIDIPTNPDTTGEIAGKDTMTTENALLTKVSAETNVSHAFDSQPFIKDTMQSQDNKLVDSHTVAQSGSTSSYSELAKKFSPASIQNSDTLSHLEQITESWRATVVTNPSVLMKSSIIDKKPLITTSRPATQIDGIKMQNTEPNLDVVVSNTGKQFINVPRVTSPSIITAEPLIVVTSIIGPATEPSNKISQGVIVPSTFDSFISNPNIVAAQPQIVTSTRPNTASWNKIPQLSEISIQTVYLSSLDHVASSGNVPKNINEGQITVDHAVSIPKTEFINVPQINIGQTTEKVITKTSLVLNSDVDIVMADVIKPINDPVFGEPMSGGSHLGISIIPKQPRGLSVEQSQKTEASESVEQSEGKKGKEKSEKSEGKNKGENPETPESIEGEQNISTPAIETPVAISKYSKSDNINIDQKGTPKTVNSKLQFTTNNIIMESSVKITTNKMEEKSGQSISNIEQLSSTKKSAQTNVTHVVSPDLKEKSVKTGPILVNAHNAGNITSNRNSTARYTPQTKSPFANQHNASVPTIKSVTSSRTFVCILNKRGRFSDTKDCRKFYICLGKAEPIEGICPNNTVFSELRKQCTKNLSHCVRNSQFQCVTEGRFSDYLNDSIYYICVKNNVGKFIRFKLQCQSGYYLNKTSIRCVLNTELSQSTSQQSRSDISKDSNQSMSSAKSEKLIKERGNNKKFECKKQGKFPEANDCRKYYICKKKGKSQYQQKSKKCDSDELFHKDKKKCVDAESYECS